MFENTHAFNQGLGCSAKPLSTVTHTLVNKVLGVFGGIVEPKIHKVWQRTVRLMRFPRLTDRCVVHLVKGLLASINLRAQMLGGLVRFCTKFFQTQRNNFGVGRHNNVVKKMFKRFGC